MHYERALYAGTAKYPNPVMRCKFNLFQDSGVVSALRWFVGATVQLLRGSFAGQSVLTQSCDQTWPNYVGSRLQQTFCKNTPKSKIFHSKWLPCSPKLWEVHRCFTKLWNCRISLSFHQGANVLLELERGKGAVDFQRNVFPLHVNEK